MLEMPAWIVHSQVTLSAPWRRNSVTMCRQAATNTGAGTCDPDLCPPPPKIRCCVTEGEEDENEENEVECKQRSPEKCELYRLYLRKDYRGLGYGKELYQFAQTTAKNMGFQEMEIWSDKKLEPAHAMYGKSGAISLGDRICNDPDNSEEWGFLLSL